MHFPMKFKRAQTLLKRQLMRGGGPADIMVPPPIPMGHKPTGAAKARRKAKR